MSRRAPIVVFAALMALFAATQWLPYLRADRQQIAGTPTLRPKSVLAEMFTRGCPAAEFVAAKDLAQVSDMGLIASMVSATLAENTGEVARYRAGKPGVVNFLFGQVMRKAGGKANPQMLKAELERQLY